MCHKLRSIAAAALLVLFSSQAYGALVVRPSLTLEERYDSNIRYDGDQETDKSDYVSIFTPFIEATQDNGRARLKVFYGLDVYMHSKKTDLDGVRHRAGIDARFEATKLTSLGIGDRYYYTEDSLQATETGILVMRTDIKSNTAYVNVNRQMTPKTGLGVNLSNSTLDFKEPSLVDTRTDEGSLTLGYRYSATATARASYTFREFSFDTNGGRSIVTHGLRVGLEKKVSPTLNIDLSGGTVYVAGTEGEYYLTATAGLDKTYKASTTNLAYTREVTNPSGLTDEINLSDRITLDIDTELTRYTSVSFMAQLAKNRTEPSGRVDINSYNTEVTGKWKPYRWLVLGAGVSHFRQWTRDTFGTGLVRNQIFLNITFMGPEWRF